MLVAWCSQVIHVDPGAVHDLRSLDIWHIVYGPTFFDFGVEQVGCS